MSVLNNHTAKQVIHNVIELHHIIQQSIHSDVMCSVLYHLDWSAQKATMIVIQLAQFRHGTTWYK